MRLLIVEDDEALRDLLIEAAQAKEFHATGASDAHQALALLNAQDFEAAVVDINLPSLDGVELIQRARAAGCEARFILISGFMNKESLLRAIPMGLTDVLEKPFAMRSFTEKLCRIAEELRPQNDQLLATISRRQQEVASGVVRGLSNKEIALELHLSEQAVKYHIGVLLKMFNGRNRRDLRQIISNAQKGAS